MSKKELGKISISDEIMEKIEEHCFSEVSQEVGGFLVGVIGEDKTEIKGVIVSTKAQSQRTSLTFTHEAWDEAYQALAADFPNLNLVGWYHSHPGFGVFMSEYDAFIQQNFFGTTGQLALVVDPLAGRRGWFKWGNEKIKNLHEEDTEKEALGGEAADYVAPQTSRAPVNVVGVVSATNVIIVLLIMVFSGLIGFLTGQSGKSEDLRSLQNTQIALKQQLNLLNSSLNNRLFVPKQDKDPASQVFYVRYAITDFERYQPYWLDIIAQRFGATTKKLLKINPGLDKAETLPDYVNVPISGWKSVPPSIAKVEVKGEAVIVEPIKPSGASSPSPSASASKK